MENPLAIYQTRYYQRLIDSIGKISFPSMKYYVLGNQRKEIKVVKIIFMKVLPVKKMILTAKTM